MQATLNQEFSATTLTCVVDAATETSACLKLSLHSHSGFTRTVKGDMTIICPADCPHKVKMMLAIHPDYHAMETIDAIRIAVFSALGIPADATWTLLLAPRAIMYIENPLIGALSSCSSG